MIDLWFRVWPYLLSAGCLLYLIHLATAQPAPTPTTIAAVCAYSSSPPTLTSGTFGLVQCNSSGQLALH